MMSKDREKAILTAYISGMKTTDIVNSFKVSTSSISKLLKKYGIENKNAHSENLNQTIYNELVLVGVSAEIIAKRHKLTEKEVKRKYKEERNRKLINDYTSGSKFDDICEKYSLSNMAVYKILNKNNISRREPHKRLSEAHQYAEITEELKKQIVNDYNDDNYKVKELLASKDIMEGFDQEIFNAIVDYVIVGGYDENGVIDSYLIRFILKREFDLNVPKDVPDEVVIQNNKIDLNSNNVLVDFINTRKYFSYERDENGKLNKVLRNGLRIRVECDIK